MCGRYSITKDLSELEKLVKFICKITDFKQRYNIALRSNVPVLVSENGKNVLKEMRWGLIPSWAKDETIGDKLINARAETLTEKPSFKKPFKKQRCLIPADGYYEWQKTGKGKIPFRFTMADDRFFCLAGLWECWIRPDLEGDLGLDDAGSWHSTRFLQRVGRRRRIFFQTLLDIGESLMVIFSLELFLGQSKKPVGHGSLPRGMSPLAVIRCGTGTVPHFVLNFMRSHNFMEAVTL